MQPPELSKAMLFWIRCPESICHMRENRWRVSDLVVKSVSWKLNMALANLWNIKGTYTPEI